jgi:hypothetical protein
LVVASGCENVPVVKLHWVEGRLPKGQHVLGNCPRSRSRIINLTRFQVVAATDQDTPVRE